MPMTNSTVTQTLLAAAQGTPAFDAVRALVDSGARIYVTSGTSYTATSIEGNVTVVNVYIKESATGFELLQHAPHEIKYRASSDIIDRLRRCNVF